MRLPYKLTLIITWLLIVAFVYYFQTSWLSSPIIKSHSSSQTLNYITLKTHSNFISIDNLPTTDTNLTSNSEPHKARLITGRIDENLRSEELIVLVVVACGDRLQESLTMIKSAIFFSGGAKLKVIVISDNPLIKGFKEKLGEWRVTSNHSFTHEILPLSFPENGKEEWRKLFKPCAAQRLFLPSLLNEVDSVLYVDTDTLFLTPLRDVWHHFSLMNSSQMAALAPEHEDPNTGWYNRFARHPYYGKLGVNSGVMLMNLTRMREFGWEKYLAPIYKQFRLKITWGDQDIINIIFHYHPERLFMYSCRYNYRSDHCMYMSVCQDANKHGVAVIHGSRRTFHSDKQPAFKAIYSSMEQYDLSTDPRQNLLLPLEQTLQQKISSNCGKVWKIYTQNLHRYLSVKEPFR